MELGGQQEAGVPGADASHHLEQAALIVPRGRHRWVGAGFGLLVRHGWCWRRRRGVGRGRRLYRLSTRRRRPRRIRCRRRVHGACRRPQRPRDRQVRRGRVLVRRRGLGSCGWRIDDQAGAVAIKVRVDRGRRHCPAAARARHQLLGRGGRRRRRGCPCALQHVQHGRRPAQRGGRRRGWRCLSPRIGRGSLRPLLGRRAAMPLRCCYRRLAAGGARSRQGQRAPLARRRRRRRRGVVHLLTVVPSSCHGPKRPPPHLARRCQLRARPVHRAGRPALGTRRHRDRHPPRRLSSATVAPPE